jgi:hypothetical protein
VPPLLELPLSALLGFGNPCALQVGEAKGLPKRRTAMLPFGDSNIEAIDLFNQHRVDPNVQIEDGRGH